MSTGAGAHLELAASLEQSGRLVDAESTYHRCIGEEPQNADARFNFACFLRRRGRLEEALEEHQSALDLGIERPEEVLSNMAVIQAELRRDAAAKLLLERALTVNPTYPPALFNLALQYEEQGDRTRALELFRQILEIDPSWHDTTRAHRARRDRRQFPTARSSGSSVARCAARTSIRSRARAFISRSARPWTTARATRRLSSSSRSAMRRAGRVCRATIASRSMPRSIASSASSRLR